MRNDNGNCGVAPNVSTAKLGKVVVVVKRLLASVVASLCLTLAVAAIRHFAAFPGGIKFDGPDTFFAFLGFLMLLFPVGIAVFFLLFTYRANRQAAVKGEGQ